MRTDEGIQLHLFDMDKYGDTIDEKEIIFVPTIKTHTEFTSLPLAGNDNTKYCIAELGGYGGMKAHNWLVVKLHNRNTSDSEIFESMTEAMAYIETNTGKRVRFRGG